MDGSAWLETRAAHSLFRVGWGYRRSRRIGPGVRLNLGKRGLGMSVGPRHAKLSVNSRRRRSLYLSALGFFFRKRM